MADTEKLAAEKQEKSTTLPEQSPGQQPSQSAQTEPVADKKAGRFAFNFINFFGLHLVGNSGLSLVLTYYVVAREGTQKFLHGLAEGLAPVVNGYDKLKQAVGFEGLSKLSQKDREVRIGHSARSAVETLCMCIAGSIILFPVKIWENNKKPLVNFFDKWLHGGRTCETEDPKNAPPEHKETWWNLIRARFLALIPIFAIDATIQNFNSDVQKHNFERNPNLTKKRSSIDTAIWSGSDKVYDKIPSWRQKLVNFFASRDIRLSNVSYMVRDQLLETINGNEQLKNISRQMSGIQSVMYHSPNETVLTAGKKALEELTHEIQKAPHYAPTLEGRKSGIEYLMKQFAGENVMTAGKKAIAEFEKQIVDKNLVKHAERAIFVEQGRMFSKEIYLTTIYTGFLFILAKTNILPWFMEKIGIKSKMDQEDFEHSLNVDVGLDAFTIEPPHPAAHISATPHSTRIKPKEPMAAPESLHSAKIDNTFTYPSRT